MELELSDAELTLLAELLRSELKEARMEISHTDTRAFRDELKRRREMMEGILGRLERTTDGTYSGA